MSKRDQEKKRRRSKRLARRRDSGQPQVPGSALALIRELEQLIKLPQPASFAGGCDPSLNRPDVIKFEFATFATKQEPGRSKFRHLADAAGKGLLGNLPNWADHWIIEEFLYHGVPGDSWHPLDAFLAQAGSRFPSTAAEQLRLWKAAEIGLFEVGEVQNDTAVFYPWDAIRGIRVGPPLRAISLNIGGVDAYRPGAGAITVTYLAPWVPADNLYCAMGYGTTVAQRDVAVLVWYLGLRHPELVCRPAPWKVNRATKENHLRLWRQRQWHRWLGQRLHFPFWAIVGTPPRGEPKLLQVTELIPSTPREAELMGIYMAVPCGDAVLAAGGTMIQPIDVASPNALALAEYRAYRERVGPPPGTHGMPAFSTLR